MSNRLFFQSPPPEPISFEKMEWFDTLDQKCKLEAILAGHVPSSPHFRLMDHPIVCPVTPNTQPYDVVTTRTPPQSPLIRSCQKGIRHIVKTSHQLVFTHPPDKPVTPSRYHSPSPDTTCCGLSLSPENPVVYA